MEAALLELASCFPARRRKDVRECKHIHTHTSLLDEGVTEGRHPEVVAQGIQVRGDHSELGKFKESCFGGRRVLN